MNWIRFRKLRIASWRIQTSEDTTLNIPRIYTRKLISWNKATIC